jgi:hypothetical protein
LGARLNANALFFAFSGCAERSIGTCSAKGVSLLQMTVLCLGGGANAGELAAEQPLELTMAWVPASCGDGVDCVGLATTVPLDPKLTWSVQVKASLGPLKMSWEEQVVSDGAPSVHLLRPPPEAWLDAAAADYVTDLSLALVATDAEGAVVALLRVPSAFLVWPEGAGGPVVWDHERQRRYAPAGVVSERARAELGDLTGVDRVGPPIVQSKQTVVTDEVL